MRKGFVGFLFQTTFKWRWKDGRIRKGKRIFAVATSARANPRLTFGMVVRRPGRPIPAAGQAVRADFGMARKRDLRSLREADRAKQGDGMTSIPKHGSSARITASLEFSPTGYLKAILLNAETDGDQAILERALTRIMNPGHMGWIRRLFHRGS